eukprot:scaffold12931_cov77-Skeletonema_marinoi.AAC.3
MTCTRAAIFFDQRARGWQLSVKHGVTSCVIFSLHLATSLLLGWSSYLCSSVVLCSLEICYRSEYVFKMLGVKMIKCRRLRVLRDIHAAQSCKCKQQAASQQYYISTLSTSFNNMLVHREEPIEIAPSSSSSWHLFITRLPHNPLQAVIFVALACCL